MSAEDSWIALTRERGKILREINLLSQHYPYQDPESGRYLLENERHATLEAKREQLRLLDERRARLEAVQREQDSLIAGQETVAQVPRTDHNDVGVAEASVDAIDVAANGKRTTSTIVPCQEPMVWRGEKWEWADFILGLRRQGLFKAESDTDALNQAAAHFVDRDRRPFNVRSVLQSYNHKRSPLGSESKPKPRS